jgi:phage terminase small subunit
MKKELTPKQKIFCDEYLIDTNGTRAYKTAYNTGNTNTAKVNASKLLTNTNIKEYIDKRMNEKTSARIANQDEVLEYFTDIMRKSMELISGCEVSPEVKDGLKAAENLAKRYGILNEKVRVELAEQIIFKGEDELE